MSRLAKDNVIISIQRSLQRNLWRTRGYLSKGLVCSDEDSLLDTKSLEILAAIHMCDMNILHLSLQSHNHRCTRVLTQMITPGVRYQRGRQKNNTLQGKLNRGVVELNIMQN